MANIIFRGGQKGQKSEKIGKKGQFFTSKLSNHYDLVSCTSESQHIKFEVI